MLADTVRYPRSLVDLSDLLRCNHGVLPTIDHLSLTITVYLLGLPRDLLCKINLSGFRPEQRKKRRE